MSKEDSVTLIYFKEKGGKARSLKMKAGIFRFLFMAVLLFLALSAFSVYFTLAVYKENRNIIEEMATIEREHRRMLKAASAVELDKKAAHRQEIPVQQAIQAEPAASPQPPGDVLLPQGQAPEAKPQASPTPSPSVAKTAEPNTAQSDLSTGVVTIENLLVEKSAGPKAVQVGFDLVKTDNGKKKLTGYVFIVGKQENTYFSLPDDATLKNGVPVDYTEGLSFDIRFRKRYDKKISLPHQSVPSLQLLVYDGEGSLLLKKMLQ